MSRTRRRTPTPPSQAAKRNLIVLAADKNTAQAVEGLLGRTASLQLRAVTFDILVHPQHDSGCYGQSPGVLGVYQKTHEHALVIFDREGSGQEQSTREELEAAAEQQLAVGWGSNAAVVVIDPELEAWLWSNSPHVATALGWRDTTKDVRQWLVEEEWLPDRTQVKPDRPKEALEAVLRHVRKPRSSAIYREIASKVSLATCTDPAFLKFRQTLAGWFPIAPAI
jgi:hypothetical protein